MFVIEDSQLEEYNKYNFFFCLIRKKNRKMKNIDYSNLLSLAGKFDALFFFVK